jgi:RNA polymerase sigma factor (sigma-70 family)
VSGWIAELKAGDAVAADKLWARYYARLVGLARRKLAAAPRQMADEQDLVVETFASFGLAARAGRFPTVRDRDDLWHMIARIMQRKAIDGLRGQRRKKRFPGKAGGEPGPASPGDAPAPAGHPVEALSGNSPTPAEAAEAAEAVDRLLGMLDVELKRVALLKLEGYTNVEIARAIDRSLPTVERRLKHIRTIWMKRQAPGPVNRG